MKYIWKTVLILILSNYVILAQTDTIKYQWPVEPLQTSHGITGTFAEFRNTGTYDHFHNAVDIGKADGSPVYPCMSGIIHSIVTTSGSNNYVSVKTQIGNKWKRITYLHIVPNPNLYVGKEVVVGETVIGNIYSGMGHVHLIEREIVNNANDYAVEINNIRNEGGLNPYLDSYPPIIHRNSLKFRLNESDYYLPSNGLSNKIDIIIKVEEQNGTSSSYLNNGTYALGYKIWSEDTSQIAYAPSDSGWKYKFDKKPLNDYVHNVYQEGIATLSNPVYILTNGSGYQSINSTGEVGDNYFDTDLLPPANYVLEIFAEDTRNNFSREYFKITITHKDVIAPKSPVLQLVENFDGNVSVRVKWAKNTEEDLLGYRLYYTGNTLLTNWNLAADEFMLPADSTSITFSNTTEFKIPTSDDIYFFYISAVDSSGNESSPSDIYSRSSYFDGTSFEKILIVDGFDRFGGSGSWTEPSHSFNVSYFKALTVTDSSVVSSCSNDAVINNIVNLNDFSLVIWFLGDESTEDNTFDVKEQSAIVDYLEAGGHLFVSGSEIGWDLERIHQNSEPSDTIFYRHYLKARFVNDGNSQMTIANGVEGTVFEGLSLNFGQVYPEDWPDDIEPVNGSNTILNYNITREDLLTPRHAGIAYSGKFGESSEIGKMVYLSFAVETMGSFSQQMDLISSVRKYFNLTTNIKNDGNEIPARFNLSQNYPNPFNPSTKINVQLPTSEFVSLIIYNSLGQQVETILSGNLKSGNYSFQWNANAFSSGIYFARMVTSKFSKTIRMILLK